MTTDANQDTESELDIDFIADYFKQGVQMDLGAGEEAEDDAKTEVGDDAGKDDTKSAEGSNETPTTKIHNLSDEELEAIVEGRTASKISSLQDRANAELQRRENEANQKELDELLRNGNPEEVGKLVQRQIQEQEQEAAIAEKVSSAYIAQVLPSILTDDFVDSLTPEEAESLLPKNFKTDGEFYKAAVEMRISKAKHGLFDEAEVTRRVEAERTADKNEARGQRVRTASPTNTPKTQDGDELQGLTGQKRKDALWARVAPTLAGQDNDE